MLRRIFPCSLLALTCIASSLPHTAEAAPQVSPKALAKAGVKTIKCPFVGFLNTGLYSRIGGNELCGLGFAKLKKPKPSKGKFPLSSSVVQGTAFESIDSAQGPMVTELFKVGNYPGLITYEVSGTKGSFKLELVDAKGKRVENLLDVPLGSSGTAAINTPGLFALKITPAPASKGEAPTYSLSMGFMEPYEGSPVSLRDLKDASIKTVNCPKSIFATSNGKYVDIPSGAVCSYQDLADGGMTAAPFSTATGLFLSNSISLEGSSGTVSFPFSAAVGTRVSYSVDDPSDKGNGSVAVQLVQLGSGKKTTLFNVKGSVSGSTTINSAGHCYLTVQVRGSSEKDAPPPTYSISIN